MSLSPSLRRTFRSPLIAAAIAALAVPLVLASPAAAAPDRTAPGPYPAAPGGTYLVQLAGAPLAAYTGGVAGLAATQPDPGARLDRSSVPAQRYSAYLRQRRDAVLAKAPGAKKLYDYSVTINGFAAKLTGAQAAALRADPGVLSVTPDQRRHADTMDTQRFLGLDGPAGLWQKRYGGPAGAGTGVIVGELDTGLWPENASFAPLPASPSDAAVKKRFKGVCDEGIERPYFACNNKVIGSRWFVKGFGAENLPAGEFLSPRDYGGHGSHTASTAAGNYGVPVVNAGERVGSMSGAAPAARIAVYKVLWGDGGFGTDSDIVAAIDAAVGDGVDVLNFSISGPSDTITDPIGLAFYNAAKAGVFVAASAGNSGPGASTVAHNSPWLTTVAAGTHDRAYAATATLGNGATYTGAGLGKAVPNAPLLASRDAGLPGSDPEDSRLCVLGKLDAQKVAGKIVVCDRGVNARVEKSEAVRAAGGVGMILVNTSENSVNSDLHAVPTIHLGHVAGAAIKEYLAGQDPTAALGAGQLEAARAPQVAAFSSRGPAKAGSGDLLKPDLMAPGVDVLAAVSPATSGGKNYDFYSGTSMAAPHVTGIAALLIQQHRSWSPAAIKSALMTTANTRDNKSQPITTDSGGAAGPFDYGSGQATPLKAIDPGLVYDAGSADWDRFTCNYSPVTPAAKDCAKLKPLNPSDLNYPSIAAGKLVGTQTITRTVTNVAAKKSSYVASISEPPGFDVTVKPTKFTLEPGARKSFTVTITRLGAAFDAYHSGSLTWLDGQHSVRSPIVVRASSFSAPVAVVGTGTAGTAAIPVRTGFTGTLTASLRGLAASEVSKVDLTPTASPLTTPAPRSQLDPAKVVPVTVPAGASLARFSTLDAEHPAGTQLYMFIYAPGSESALISLSLTAENTIEVADPVPGQYVVVIALISGGPVTATLNSWSVGSSPAGNATITPASQPVTAGQSLAPVVSWSGLEPGRRWLGVATFAGGGITPVRTTVAVTS